MNRYIVLRSEDNRKALEACIEANWKAIAGSRKPLAVHVTLHTERRTTKQNARLHALLMRISEQAWQDGKQYPLEAWKEFYKQRFIGFEETALPDGSVRKTAISSTTLNKEEFQRFMDQIELDAIETYGVDFSYD